MGRQPRPFLLGLGTGRPSRQQLPRRREADGKVVDKSVRRAAASGGEAHWLRAHGHEHAPWALGPLGPAAARPQHGKTARTSLRRAIRCRELALHGGRYRVAARHDARRGLGLATYLSRIPRGPPRRQRLGAARRRCRARAPVMSPSCSSCGNSSGFMINLMSSWHRPLRSSIAASAAHGAQSFNSSAWRRSGRLPRSSRTNRTSRTKILRC